MNPESTIVGGATKAVRLAAEEFAKYWKLVTGRDLPDVPEAIASFKVDPALDAAHDEYRIRSVADGVEFVGSNGRSVFYAVYDFFERRAGCRWFWDGDVVPHRDEIDLCGLDVREKSRFEYRAIRYFAHRGLTRFQAEHWGRKEWMREIDWCLKSRLNCFMPRIGMDDTWQKAFPDIVGYPGPDDPSDDNMGGFDNRVPFWDLRHRGELRKFFTEYAFDRGLMVPTDFGTMTHWYARTPVPFLEAKNPPFLPQANNNYKQRTGLVWDVFQGEWADDYIHLTEAFIDAGYGTPDLLHTIGLGERLCYDDRAKNLQLKKDVLARMTKKALAKYPDSKILLAGWDFYSTWNPDEVKTLVAELDPERTIIWDYEGEVAPGSDNSGWSHPERNFTNWGVVGKFPYTYGVFLAYECALDIRAHYGIIEEREKIIAADPFCKGYILWPESSHTDTFLLSYFTTNAWQPGHGHEALLPVFCRDRYGEKASVFEPIWRKALPISQLLGWWDNWGRELLSWLKTYRRGHDLEEDEGLLSSVPGIFSDLAAITPEDDFQRRDIVDIARTVGDRLSIWGRHRLLKSFDAWCDGADNAGDIRFWCERYLEIVKANTEILGLHTDFSLCESLDRLAEEAPIFSRDFDKVLLDNASNAYCRSHQYEIAAGCYIPFAEAVVRELLRRVDAGERERIPDEWASKTREACLADLKGRGIEAYRPSSSRTADEYRRVLTAACQAGERCFHSQSRLPGAAPAAGIALAAEPSSDVLVVVDPSSDVGPVKLMNAVNNGPVAARSSDQTRGNFADFQALRVPYARTHDSINQATSNGHTVDISAVFPNFEADENDPASYDFAYTDKFLETIIAAGTKPFFRLGQTIENGIKKYHVFPPKDFAKWARVCEHVILHCNEGWCDGHRWGIEYWEIWNEADAQPDELRTKSCQWQGTKAEFFEFYEIVAKHLKGRFPNLKIGGPALGWRMDWAEEFLKWQRGRGTSIDFFSWHAYTGGVARLKSQSRQVRQLLDKNGYAGAESILDEWNYIKNWTTDFAYTVRVIASNMGGAFTAAYLCEAQNSPIDMLMYYDARPGTVFNGLFDFRTFAPLPAYYALFSWADLRDLGTQVAAEVAAPASEDGTVVTAVAAKGADDSLGVLVVRYCEDRNVTASKTFTLRLASGSFAGRVRGYVTDADRLHSPVHLVPRDDGTVSFTLAPNAFIYIEAHFAKAIVA